MTGWRRDSGVTEVVSAAFETSRVVWPWPIAARAAWEMCSLELKLSVKSSRDTVTEIDP